VDLLNILKKILVRSPQKGVHPISPNGARLKVVLRIGAGLGVALAISVGALKNFDVLKKHVLQALQKNAEMVKGCENELGVLGVHGVLRSDKSIEIDHHTLFQGKMHPSSGLFAWLAIGSTHWGGSYLYRMQQDSKVGTTSHSLGVGDEKLDRGNTFAVGYVLLDRAQSLQLEEIVKQRRDRRIDQEIDQISGLACKFFVSRSEL
jgi:hypothetical protein